MFRVRVALHGIRFLGESKMHPNDYGFLLWADIRNIKSLEDAEKSIAVIQQENTILNGSADAHYKSQFYATIRLTGHYYAIRVQTEKYQYYLNSAKAMSKKEGWSPEVEKLLALAKAAAQLASSHLDKYNEQLSPLLALKEANNKANLKDLAADFVQNPRTDYFTKQIAVIENALKGKSL